MSRAAPLPHDLTDQEGFLAPVSNAWRRELVRWCAEPRTRRDIFREFVCAGKKQRYAALHDLCASGWLREHGGSYTLNVVAVSALERLAESVAGAEIYPFEDVTGCDASVAALRRRSCRAILNLMRATPRPVLWRELRDTCDLTAVDAKVACTILVETYAIRETAQGVFELTLHGFPALTAYLDALKGRQYELARS